MSDTKRKWTGGEWGIASHYITGTVRVASETNEHIADVRGKHNACLIAAAPQLLEAVERVSDMLHKAANGKFKSPGTSEKISAHKHMEREAREILEAALSAALGE